MNNHMIRPSTATMPSTGCGAGHQRAGIVNDGTQHAGRDAVYQVTRARHMWFGNRDECD